MKTIPEIVMPHIIKALKVLEGDIIRIVNPADKTDYVHCIITKSGFMSIKDGSYLPSELGKFISGIYVFDRKLFYPKEGETFYYISKGRAYPSQLPYDDDNYYHYQWKVEGNCFKTLFECEVALEKE